ncbi:MAG: hypothetical protein ACM3XO_10885 [Bacteroidota bacterium]
MTKPPTGAMCGWRYSMEATFQNKREDLQALCDYMVRETNQGKKVGRYPFIVWLEGADLGSFFVGLFMPGLSGIWQAGVGGAIFFFLGISLIKNHNK